MAAISRGVQSLWRNSACLIMGSGPVQYVKTPLVSTKGNIQCYVKEKGVKEPEFLFVKRKGSSSAWVSVTIEYDIL